MTLIAADATTAAASDPIVGVGLAVVTAGIVFVVLLAIGFMIIARRGRRSVKGRPVDDLAMRANIALVRLDDDVAEALDELGFAIAQFGRSPTGTLESALATARSNLASAFALKQKLDDAVADSPAEIREWNARILMLCETASEKLHDERTVLDGMRGLERSASRDLDAVRESISNSRRRLPLAMDAVTASARRYSAQAIAPVADAPAEVERLLSAATRTADDAAAQVDDAGVSSIASTVRSAERDARSASNLLDRIDRHGEALAASSLRLVTFAADARSMATDARRLRDAAPDPRSGAAIAAAVALVEDAVRVSTDPSGLSDPDHAIARIDAAADALDTAVAGARTQQQRLTHAREALRGALLTAQSQLATTHAYIDGHRGRVSAGARTRLAEAERLLAIAEVESDPVIALDTARSSATYSRDADALARYDGLH